MSNRINTYYFCEYKGSKGKWLFYSWDTSLRGAIENSDAGVQRLFRIIKFSTSGASIVRQWDADGKRIV